MSIHIPIKKTWNSASKYRWPIFLVWSLWLTLECFGLGPFSYVRIHDFGDSLFPLQMGGVREFFDYGFSYWSAQAGCGFDRLAATGPLFRVDSLFYFTSPGWLTYGLIIFIQRFIAGYFTYRLCKDYLKLGELPSVFAGLAYSISFFLVQSQFAGAAGFPLILWSLEYIHERKSFTKYLLAGLLGVFVLFSSAFALSIPFMLITALAWFVLLRRIYSLRFLSLFAVFSVILLAGEIPVIWAQAVNAPISYRVDITYMYKLPWTAWDHYVFDRITTLLVWAGLGGGIVGLYLSRLRDRNLLMIMVLLVFCMAATPLRLLQLHYFDMGFLTSFGYDRFYLLAPFFAIIAGAYGLYLLRLLGIPRRWIFQNGPHYGEKISTILCIIAICFLVVASLGIKSEHYQLWESGSRYATMYENPNVQQLKTDADSAPFRVASIAHNIHPGYANAYGLETVDGYVSLYSKTYHDFWGKVIEPLTSKDEQRYNYFHGGGHRLYLYSPSNRDFDRIVEVPFSDYYNLDLLSLANTKYLISDLPISDDHLLLLPSQIENEETGDRSLIDRIQLTRQLYIYENENCLPRFFLCDNVSVFGDSAQLLEAMAEADINSLRDSVFMEEVFVSDMGADQLGFTRGEIAVEEYSPDRITLLANLDGPGVLVISNSYNPYWTCKVNGIDQDIFPAYHTFMGVFLSGGESSVQLEYQPPYWTFR